MDKPYDKLLVNAMCAGALQVLKGISGTTFAYQQSDEVSILITDFKSVKTEAPYDYNIQKLASVSASIMTAAFNDNMHRVYELKTNHLAFFDARVFCIPDRIEVYNYFLWRQRDCIRNSISGLAQAHFSHNELHGLNTDQMQEKLFQERGINWSKEPDEFKNGVITWPWGESYGLPDAISKDPDAFMRYIPVRED